MAGFMETINKALGRKDSGTKGTHSSVVIDGFLAPHEMNRNLASREKRYQLYSEILVNCPIVAAGIRQYLNLITKAIWSFKPSEADTTGEYAEFVRQALMDDPTTAFHQVVRRAAMYRYYGFQVQEWTAKIRDDGKITFADIAPRGQSTIYRWDVNPKDGNTKGLIQLHPVTFKEIYIPRSKLFYIVDEAMQDTPEGLGVARQLVEPYARLQRYLQLEGIGFETDLRGIPIGKVPFLEIMEAVKNGELTDEDGKKLIAPIKDFIQGHIRSKNLGLVMDSGVHTSEDEARRPASAAPKYDVELLKGSSNSFRENAQAIERINREMARVLGVEQLMLGADGKGSLALSMDKTNSFFLLVDSVLTEIKAMIKNDAIGTLWRLNGFPDEMRPTPVTDAVRNLNGRDLAGALLDLHNAGAPVLTGDSLTEAYEVLGLTAPEGEPNYGGGNGGGE